MTAKKPQLEVVNSSGPRIEQDRELRIQIPDSVSSRVKIVSIDGDESDWVLINISRFGALIKKEAGDLKLSKDDSISEIIIKVDEQIVYIGSGRVINYRNEDNWHLAGVLLHEQVEIEKVTAITSFGERGSSSKANSEIVKNFKTINREFKTLVADLHTLLISIKDSLLLEESEIQSLARSDVHRKRLEEQAVNLAISLYTDQIRALFSEFQAVTSGFSQEEHQLHKKYFRKNFHPMSIGAPFIKRAFSKPLGYAGDYGLMMMFYEYKDIGENLYDKFFHRFSCNEPSAVANKNRVYLLADMLVNNVLSSNDPSYKVSSIACGPAMEISLALEQLADAKLSDRDSIECVLIDQERLALDKARENIRKVYNAKNFKLKTYSEDAVLGFIKKKAFVRDFDGSDQIISAGLFDYLSDRVATRLIESLFDLLKPGGELIVGNVSKNSPDRFSMMYFMEWILMLRSESDLLGLVPDTVRSQSKVSIKKENLGLNLFLVIKKNA